MRLEPLAPGSTLDLDDEAAGAPAGALDKDAAVAETERLARRIDELQNALYAEGRRALLVVLQGRDTAGKDGTIRKVFGPLNPLGLTVASFKAPSPIELAHDYLWRVHQAVPVRGTIGVFNRSHYEDVLVVRVHELVPEAVWRAALRPDRAVRADADRERRHHPQVLPAHLTEGAAGAAAGASGRSRRNTGSSRRATWPSGSGGTNTPRRTGRRSSGPARPRRPGTWSPRTRNTCVTCWWRRWWRSGWSGWIRSTPARPRDWSSSGGRCAELSSCRRGRR